MSRPQNPIIPYNVPLQVLDKTLSRLLPMSEADAEERRKQELAAPDTDFARRYELMRTVHGRGTAINSNS